MDGDRAFFAHLLVSQKAFVWCVCDNGDDGGESAMMLQNRLNSCTHLLSFSVWMWELLKANFVLISWYESHSYITHFSLGTGVYFLKVYKIYFILCTCACVCALCAWRPKQGIGSPGAGLTNEPPDVGIKNWAQGLCRSSIRSLTVSLSLQPRRVYIILIWLLTSKGPYGI